MELREQEHHYQLEKTDRGFEIIPEEYHRPIVGAHLEINGEWTLYYRHEDDLDMDGNEMYNRIGSHILYDFYGILEKLVKTLYLTWEVPDEKKNLKTTESGVVYDPCEVPVSEWAIIQTKRTLGKKARDFWKETMDILDPEVEEVLRKCYAVARNSGAWGRLYSIISKRDKDDYYRFLFNDLKNFYPARVSVLHDANLWVGTQDQYGESRADWRLSFQGGGQFYTSLNKTLSNMPQGITYHWLFGLQKLRLPEPATTRLKLFAYTYLGRFYSNQIAKFEKVILRSSEETIREAVEYIWHYLPTIETGDFRKPKGIAHAFSIMYDYPHDIGKWDMVGLARRSEEYHHIRQQERLLHSTRWDIEYEDLEKLPTAKPPIKLPTAKGITLLDTYKAVVDEGTLMNHCIASYAQNAVVGDDYLFHVEYKGEMASVQVKPEGFVGQSYGPNDRINGASKYGARVLGEWAKQLEGTQPIIDKRVFEIKEKPKGEVRYTVEGDEIPF